jgi:hypothetical protein
MTTLLQPPTNDVFSNSLNGLPTLDDPTQLWLSPLSLSPSGNEPLIQSLREQKETIKFVEYSIGLALDF